MNNNLDMKKICTTEGSGDVYIKSDSEIMPLLQLILYCIPIVEADMKARGLEKSVILDNLRYYYSFEGPL